MFGATTTYHRLAWQLRAQIAPVVDDREVAIVCWRKAGIWPPAFAPVEPSGSRLGVDDAEPGRRPTCAGWVEGPDGPVLAATKTRRNHSVDLDTATCALLSRHADDRVGRNDGFVFSDDGGRTAWKPNRVTEAFIRHRRAAGLRSFRLHDRAASWRPRCCTRACPSWSCPAGSTTNACPRPWTATPTPCRAAMPTQPPRSDDSCSDRPDHRPSVWGGLTTRASSG